MQGSGGSAILVFLSGAALLVYSAEKLIGYLIGAARGLKVSVFLLAIVLTGIEFDDVFLGVALGLEDLDGAALGVVFGTALSLPGITLALAAIVAPFRVEIPRDYLAIFALSPLALLPFAVDGDVGAADGVVLIAAFLAFVAYIYARESRGMVAVFRSTEVTEAVRDSDGRSLADTSLFGQGAPRPPWRTLGLAVVALAGLVVGAATAGLGTEGIVDSYGLAGTIFGATIVTAVLSIEDILLTVEPVRRGAPEAGIGNVIGSVVFAVTAKLGVIALAGSIAVGPLALTWHFPALVVLTGLAAYFVSTRGLRRWHGWVLLALYATYWIVSFAAFGTVPAESE